MMYVFRYEIMKEKYDALCITEKELQEKWKLLEVTFRDYIFLRILDSQDKV